MVVASNAHLTSTDAPRSSSNLANLSLSLAAATCSTVKPCESNSESSTADTADLSPPWSSSFCLKD